MAINEPRENVNRVVNLTNNSNSSVIASLSDDTVSLDTVIPFDDRSHDTLICLTDAPAAAVKGTC